MATKEVVSPFPAVATGKPRWLQRVDLHLAALLLIVAFIAGIRVRLLNMPLERDEGEYAYAGQLILQGIPPYQLVYNTKLPGTYAAYAAMMMVLGQTGRGIHLGLLLVNAASTILLYLLAKRLFGALAGTIAGASFALLSSHQQVYGLAAHATHFVTLAALAGLILLLRAEEKKDEASFFWCGLAFGIVYLMKQQGILLGVFALCYLGWRCRPAGPHTPHAAAAGATRVGQLGWTAWTKDMGAFLLAAALPFVITCIVLFRAGVFRAFWFWTFSYARQYVTTTSLAEGRNNFSRAASYMLIFTPWLLALALLGLFLVLWDPKVRRHAAFVIGLFAFSFATVCVGLYFRPHYFIPLIPAVAILIAVAVISSVNLIEQKGWPRWVGVVPVLIFAAAWVLAVQRNSEIFFKVTSQRAARICYLANPFAEAVPVAEYLRQHTAPSDTIMVLGSEPEIYFEAHRQSASGYIYMYSLMEDQAYWPVMQKQMEGEVEGKRPAYVVFVNIPYSWNFRQGSPQMDAMGKWIGQYLSTGFDLVGVVEVVDPESRYFWDNATRGHPQSRLAINIFRRKD